MRISIILIFGLFIENSINGQEYDNVWLFGYHPNIPEEYFGGSVLDFSTEPPTVEYFEIPLNFRANSVISNASGELLAYSNGCQIMDGNNMLMENGDSINPGRIHDLYCDFGYPTPQGVIMIPARVESGNYRMIHHWMSDDGFVRELRSTEIVYTNDDSIGIIANKNMVIASGFYTNDLTAVRHANGRDWWILLTRSESNIFESYLSTPLAVIPIDTQAIGEAWSFKDWSGQVTFSPDGSKYVRVNPYNGLHIYDFDRCTGALSNSIVIDFSHDTISSSGAAFSLDSRFLYVSASRYTYQFDMWAKDVAGSRATVAVYDGFQGPLSTKFYHQMLAPNGKIYITAPSSVRYLHVIHDPHVKGNACNVEQHGIELPALHAFSIPNFPHYRLGPIDGSTCDTLGLSNYPIASFRYEQMIPDLATIRFTDLSYFAPEVWEWNFGDGTFATGANQIHSYIATGTYTVCLTVRNANGVHTSCQDVYVEKSLLTEDSAIIPLSVYPNPFTDYIEISLSRHEVIDIKLCDIDARETIHVSMSCPCRISLKHLPAGVYFYRLERTTSVEVGKLIKIDSE